MSSTPGPTPAAPARPATVSACVIALDEEQRLTDCLRSVSFCDEIVVVDSGSRDRTVALAREHGAHVVEQPWLGFGGQRNVAIDHASGDWILEVDADERVTDELREQIRAFVAAAPADVDAAVLPLRERFLGAGLGPSAKYPRYRTRLFRRGVYRHDEDRTVHEGLWPRGRTWAFTGDLEHLLAGSWREAFHDAWTYARLEAQQSAHPASAAAYVNRILLRPAAKLASRLLLDGGWRDGAPGLAKITLDCASDAVVGVRQLFGRRRNAAGAGDAAVDAGRAPGGAGGSAGGHYARSMRVGSVRILALALGEDAARDGEAWLAKARAAGADVGLVSDARAEANAPQRVRALEGAGPLVVIRAMDAEDQLRPVDALVPIGRRARRLTRLLPRRAFRIDTLIDAGTEPAAAVAELRRRTRAGVPG